MPHRRPGTKGYATRAHARSHSSRSRIIPASVGGGGVSRGHIAALPGAQHRPGQQGSRTLLPQSSSFELQDITHIGSRIRRADNINLGGVKTRHPFSSCEVPCSDDNSSVGRSFVHRPTIPSLPTRVSPSGIGARAPAGGVARVVIGLVCASMRNQVRRVAELGRARRHEHRP